MSSEVKKSGHILIVDDAPDIQNLLAQLLRSEGYTVSVAANGIEALSYLRTTPSLPNIILLDLMMPDMDGFQFRIEQEQDARLANIPIVVMTAGGNVQASSQKLGAKGFLRKPFKDLDSIMGMVRKFSLDVP